MRGGWYVVVLLACAGCSGEPTPETAPVTGVVTYKGQPVPEATVSLVPLAQGGRPATAVTGADGKFSVKTFLSESQVEGATPGEYAIAVTKMSAPAEPPRGVTQAELQAWAAKGDLPRSLLPRMYQDPAKSKLKTTVQPGTNPPLALDLMD